ncbi:MAG TPA: DegV family protein [Candidatus Limnocylindria bacterium]|nr:DegV family protein [Candidatus Limnocylindria bacterium]
MTERFAIVVDGTASLTPEVQREFDIRLMPLHVDIGKESFTANVDLTAEEFYRKIAAPGVLTGTSQPSMGECRDVYDSIVQGGTTNLLVLTIATELSGTYSVASTTAQAMPSARIEVVDTRSLAGGISLIATAVGRLRRSGGSFEDAVALATRMAGKVQLFAVADTLEYLKRSGRVSGAAALFGSVLQVKPILEVANGVVHPVDKVRSRDKAVARMKELMLSRVPEGSRIHACTLHTNEPERAGDVATWVQEHFHCVEHWTAEAGPVIGARAGPGVVGICWYREEDAR